MRLSRIEGSVRGVGDAFMCSLGFGQFLNRSEGAGEKAQSQHGLASLWAAFEVSSSGHLLFIHFDSCLTITWRYDAS